MLLALLFWPGSLLTLHALGRAMRRSVALPPPAGPGVTRRARWKARAAGDQHALFLLAWIVPAWLVFEIVGTKLPHYPMPLYPAVALLTAIAVVDLADRVTAPPKPLPPLGGLIIWVLLGIGLTAVAPVAVASLARNPVLAGAGAARRGRHLRAHALSIGASIAFSLNLLQFVLPRTEPLRTTARLAELIGRAPPDAPVASVGYNEDSLTFATRARAVSLRPGSSDDWAASHPGGVLVLPTDAVQPLGWNAIGRVEGLNYSKGDRVDLTVYRRADQSATQTPPQPAPQSAPPEGPP